MNPLYATALLAIGLILSNVVHAHIGVHANGSFETGLMHPFSGMDHMLAMLAVGLWAAQSGGRNVLALPAAFITAMALGAVIGLSGAALPLAETGIALSVAILGAMLALAVRGEWQWSAPLIALFALFHGLAHGAEIPQFVNPAGYFAGFLMATAMLHACGVAAAITLKDRVLALRAGGAAIGFAGLWMVLAA
jgi:urease accessory protein